MIRTGLSACKICTYPRCPKLLAKVLSNFNIFIGDPDDIVLSVCFAELSTSSKEDFLEGLSAEASLSFDNSGFTDLAEIFPIFLTLKEGQNCYKINSA